MAEQLEVTAAWGGGFEAVASARGHELTIDEPERAGGGDAGMMPTEVFCAALAGCFCLAVAHVAAKRSLEIGDLSVTVRAERADGELRYGRLVVETSAELPDGQRRRLVERARRFCWVSNMLQAGVELEYR